MLSDFFFPRKDARTLVSISRMFPLSMEGLERGMRLPGK